jgi:hypothetical protein
MEDSSNKSHHEPWNKGKLVVSIRSTRTGLIEGDTEIIGHNSPFALLSSASCRTAHRNTRRTIAEQSQCDKPFDQVWVTLTKREHIELVMEANYWKAAHQRAVIRQQWLELQRSELLAGLAQHKAQLRCEFEQTLAQARQSQQQQLQQVAQEKAHLQAQLEVANAQIRDLRQRVFGRKSECSKGANQAQSKDGHTPKSRGHQKGHCGHGRTTQTDLPLHHETRDLASPQCPKCGLSLQALAGFEDSSVVEIEVKAYQRVIHRRRYRRMCTCPDSGSGQTPL